MCVRRGCATMFNVVFYNLTTFICTCWLRECGRECYTIVLSARFCVITCAIVVCFWVLQCAAPPACEHIKNNHINVARVLVDIVNFSRARQRAHYLSWVYSTGWLAGCGDGGRKFTHARRCVAKVRQFTACSFYCFNRTRCCSVLLCINLHNTAHYAHAYCTHTQHACDK